MLAETGRDSIKSPSPREILTKWKRTIPRSVSVRARASEQRNEENQRLKRTLKTSLFSVSVCRAILFEMLLYIHLFICILDPSIAPHFIAFASLFVFLSSSYLRANLISNKIICSICGCFYSRIFFSWPVSKCFFYRANAIVEFVSKFVLYCTMLTTNEKKGRVQNENRANWNDERNGLRVANIWIVCVCMRKLKLDNILATLHLLCAKFHVDSLRLVADVSSLAGSQSINPSHM